jgi:hypothetical protein
LMMKVPAWTLATRRRAGSREATRMLTASGAGYGLEVQDIRTGWLIRRKLFSFQALVWFLLLIQVDEKKQEYIEAHEPF